MGRSFSSLSKFSDRSQEKPSKVLFLLHRTWAIVVTDRWTKARLSRPSTRGEDTISEYQSQYSYCSCAKCQWQETMSFSSDYAR